LIILKILFGRDVSKTKKKNYALASPGLKGHFSFSHLLTKTGGHFSSRRGWEGGAELVEGILPDGFGDVGERGELRSLRQARCGVQALLAL
jgi:hypothetical protein